MKPHRVVIMQPYFLPYRNYFGLIRRCDDFVVFDDVQFCRKWQQRNCVPDGCSGKRWLTVPVVSRRPSLQKIREVVIVDRGNWRPRMLSVIRRLYQDHEAFDAVFPELRQLLLAEHDRLVDLNFDLLVWSVSKSGLSQPQWRWASELGFTDLGRSERLVKICQGLGAAEYVCGPAAKAYLREDLFEEAGIRVVWNEESYAPYPQRLTDRFDHFVSVLDLLMNHGSDAWRYLEPTDG